MADMREAKETDTYNEKEGRLSPTASLKECEQGGSSNGATVSIRYRVEESTIVKT